MISTFKKWIAEIKDGHVDWEQLEATLIQSDLGITLSHKILEHLKSKSLSAATVQKAVMDELLSLWNKPMRRLEPLKGMMNVWLVIGVNGTGKTTTIAKLAAKFQSEGKKVFLVGADTFRAAALDQLKVWAERLGVGIFCGKEGGDPASAVYEGMEAARKAGADLVLVDTAGRLHNKENLMRELVKVKRVIGKQDAAAPHEVLLVVDGTNGMNAVSQAKEFNETLCVTAMIVTKLDSSAKGGAIAACKSEVGLDTLFVGRGEKTKNLQEFIPQDYVKEFF